MKTYQSCGKITIEKNSKSALVKTMLPELLHNGKYKYIEYHNISNDDYYGVLGVLVMDGEPNTDLTKYNSANRMVQVDANQIILTDLLPVNGGKDFSGLSQNDQIHFMCLHDDDFKVTDAVLKRFQQALPKFPDDREPKVGNGGILTFEGC
ncbi:hypothetical protein [Flavobacterium humi]|uniref:Uncharacterized protein n=1 Tax=Flavobacterium humi TaxID=2562683 RepID=A0A4Z0LA46_9FLAO|nr:hypothetical protein [Flavobacterium humi]TGD59209.1 hypothetical protein E4635_04985 [Flavobacterium humi]